MKKTVSVIALLLFAFTMNAQEFTVKTDPNAGIFEFVSETVDYGTIKQNSEPNRTFTFKNIGKAPIIISKAKGSCGCTVPTVPKRPIMPGETAKIGVKYATNRIGAFSKSITLYSNATEKTKIIRIKGKVLGTNTKAKTTLEKPKSMLSAK